MSNTYVVVGGVTFTEPRSAISIYRKLQDLLIAGKINAGYQEQAELMCEMLLNGIVQYSKEEDKEMYEECEMLYIYEEANNMFVCPLECYKELVFGGSSALPASYDDKS